MSSVHISWDNWRALAPDQEQGCSICFAKKCFHFLYVPFPLKSLGLILSIFLKVPSFLSWGTVAVALFYNLLIPMYSSWKLQWSSITHVCINYWNPFSPCKNGLKVLLGKCAESTLTAQTQGGGQWTWLWEGKGETKLVRCELYLL